jgi:predicted nucleic acid-binding protein
VEAFKTLRGPLFSTWMPITEAMYLLGFSSRAQDALLEMVARQAIRVLPIGIDDLPEIRAFMAKYRDLPMDFADATLVQIANREKIGRIFTLDRRDFSVYRLSEGRSFDIVPAL